MVPTTTWAGVAGVLGVSSDKYTIKTQTYPYESGPFSTAETWNQALETTCKMSINTCLNNISKVMQDTGLSKQVAWEAATPKPAPVEVPKIRSAA